MSNVRKIYNLGNKIKEITERKIFKVSLMSFLTIFLLFGVLNSYAQEEPHRLLLRIGRVKKIS
jgi:ATP/ADP translocase